MGVARAKKEVEKEREILVKGREKAGGRDEHARDEKSVPKS